jgi:type III pantothenate kinase
MNLIVDVGNTQLMGGLFDKDNLMLRFRKNSTASTSSDELGVFFRSVIRENGFDPKDIKQIGICSVVPGMNHSLASACIKYFSLEPFILKSGVDTTGLDIQYNSPQDVGADRLANGIAGVELFPGRDLIIIDFGTATTVDIITKKREYLGGSIHAGMKISTTALEQKTAKLPEVEILKPEQPWGRSTRESIQAGLYYGHLGFIKETLYQLENTLFTQEKPLVIATGGLSSLFKDCGIFDHIIGDLVLLGIQYAMKLNNSQEKNQ